ncbi:unnamed protein product [Amoebophrya sp. A120]|nr:unnamed protein product [Amoebophrya sp. A120]|eukprot:GSA120T00011809001.1
MDGLVEETTELLAKVKALRNRADKRAEGEFYANRCFVSLLSNVAGAYFDEQARLPDSPRILELEKEVRDEYDRLKRLLLRPGHDTEANLRRVEYLEMYVLRNSLFREGKTRLTKRNDASDETVDLLQRVRLISHRFFKKHGTKDETDLASRFPALPELDVWARWFLMRAYQMRQEDDKIPPLIKEIDATRNRHMKRICEAWYGVEVQKKPLNQVDKHLLQQYPPGKDIDDSMPETLRELVDALHYAQERTNGAMSPEDDLAAHITLLKKHDIGPASAIGAARTILTTIANADQGRSQGCGATAIPEDARSEALRLVLYPPSQLRLLATHTHMDLLSKESRFLHDRLALCPSKEDRAEYAGGALPGGIDQHKNCHVLLRNSQRWSSKWELGRSDKGTLSADVLAAFVGVCMRAGESVGEALTPGRDSEGKTVSNTNEPGKSGVQEVNADARQAARSAGRRRAPARPVTCRRRIQIPPNAAAGNLARKPRGNGRPFPRGAAEGSRSRDPEAA